MNAKFVQRMPEDLHERVKKLAEEYGVSLNSLINMACEEFEKTGKFGDIEKRITRIEEELHELKHKK